MSVSSKSYCFVRVIKSRSRGSAAYVAWEICEMHTEFMRVPQRFTISALLGGDFAQRRILISYGNFGTT